MVYSKEVYRKKCNEKYNNKYEYNLENFENIHSTITVNNHKNIRNNTYF